MQLRRDLRRLLARPGALLVQPPELGACPSGHRRQCPEKSFSESDFPSVKAALGDAKAKLGADPSLLRPEVTEFVAGTDYTEHSFPGARLIYLALQQLKKGRKPEDAESFARKLGFEKSHLSAVYDFLWDDQSPSASPPGEVQEEAEQFLEATEAKG